MPDLTFSDLTLLSHSANISIIVDCIQPFELVTSRAVTDTKMLLQLSENFRDASSTLLFYKGEKVFDEIDAKNINAEMPHKIIQTSDTNGNNRHYLPHSC